MFACAVFAWKWPWENLSLIRRATPRSTRLFFMSYPVGIYDGQYGIDVLCFEW